MYKISCCALELHSFSVNSAAEKGIQSLVYACLDLCISVLAPLIALQAYRQESWRTVSTLYALKLGFLQCGANTRKLWGKIEKGTDISRRGY